jgi:hypothetical protein
MSKQVAPTCHDDHGKIDSTLKDAFDDESTPYTPLKAALFAYRDAVRAALLGHREVLRAAFGVELTSPVYSELTQAGDHAMVMYFSFNSVGQHTLLGAFYREGSGDWEPLKSQAAYRSECEQDLHMASNPAGWSSRADYDAHVAYVEERYYAKASMFTRAPQQQR